MIKLRWVTPERGEAGVIVSNYEGPGSVVKPLQALKLQFQQEKDGNWYDVQTEVPDGS